MAIKITLFFIVLTVLTAILIPAALRVKKKSNSSIMKDMPVKPGKGVDLKALFEIEDIKRGVIILTGDRYRMVLRLASADFFLLSEAEQTQVEDALKAVLMGLSFPVGFLVTSEALKTGKAVQNIKDMYSGLNDSIKAYAENYAAYLEGLSKQRTAAARSAYLIIPFDTVKGFDHAYSELMARASILADGLVSAKMTSEILNTPAIVDLLSHMLNRGQSWRPGEADRAGVMDYYHISERQVDYTVQTA